jgi:hypothetical protein
LVKQNGLPPMHPGLQRKSFFADVAAKKIGAVEREERSTPWFLALQRQKCAQILVNGF